jgi:L-lactate permease
MPAAMVAGAAAHGVVYGAVRIYWVLLCAVFVYEVTVETGHFATIKDSVGDVTPDRRLQALLIAFAFSAVLEGAGGGGAPVAIAGAMMVGLGFQPFAAAMLCLIANTAPVAFGGVGNPIRALVAVTGLGDADLSAMVGRILPILALLLPFWLVRTMTSWASAFEVWPGLLICGGVAAAIQFYWSNFQDSSLVDIVGGMTTLIALALFFKVWKPKTVWRYPAEPPAKDKIRTHSGLEILHAWSPFLLMAGLVIVWGMPAVKKILDPTTLSIPVPGLHMQVVRVPPVVDKVEYQDAKFELAWLSSVGTATFLSGLLSGPILGHELAAHAGHLLSHLLPDAIQHGRHPGDAGSGIRDPLLRHGRGDGTRHDAHRPIVSVLRNSSRLARRGADRHRRGLERVVRQSAGDHGKSIGSESGADGGGEFGGRRDGKDDQRRVHHRGVRGGRRGGKRGRSVPGRTPSLHRSGSFGGADRIFFFIPRSGLDSVRQGLGTLKAHAFKGPCLGSPDAF